MYHAKQTGRAYVLTKTADGWKQAAELDISDVGADTDFGNSVAISRTTAIVGAVGCKNMAGRAFVFTKTAAGWQQVAELKGSDTVAHLGGDLGHDRCCGCTGRQQCRPGVRVHENRGQLETGR
jgi:hypothetical protein